MAETKPAKAWTAAAGALVNVLAIAVVASQDGKFTNDEFGAIGSALFVGIVTVYGVWKVRNLPVERAGNGTDNQAGNV